MHFTGVVEAWEHGLRVRDPFSGYVLELAHSAEAGTWVEVTGDELHVLAVPRSALANLYDLAARYQLDPAFPPDVMEEAYALTAAPLLDDGLDDLRHLPFCTIDEETSRDLDQAVYVEPEGDGWRVAYAIADAAWFVRPGTALFSHALARGSSYYLPGLTLPMLPRLLSEDLVSLNPDVDRRAMVFWMHVDACGECTSTEVRRAAVHSQAKLSYDGVQTWLDGGPPPSPRDAVLASLRAMVAVGLARLSREAERHVARYRRREVAASLRSRRGLRFVAVTDLRNDVERYNEQISLLANAEGARLLAEATRPGLEPVFRVHRAPAAPRLAQFADFAAAMVEAHGLDPDRWSWRPGDSLSDYLQGLPTAGPQARLARAIHRQALLTNQRSVFQAQPGPHHGVGAALYSRFTAPMREVVGVYVHQELWEALGVEPVSQAHPELRDAVIAAGNRARDLQRRLDREANRLVLDQILSADQEGGAQRTGTVMGITRSKVHVTFDDPPIDVKLYRQHLEQARGADLVAGADGVTLRERDTGEVVLRTGQEARVQVKGHDTTRDRWVLELS